MTKPPKARSQGEKKSADDHADLSGVPDGFKGLGVLPILVDLAPVVVVVGVGDVVALVGVIAADQNGVVVADQALLGALDVVGPIVGGGPPQGHVAHHAVARQQLPLQVSDGGPAEIGAGVVAAAVGVGILRELGRVDGGAGPLGGVGNVGGADEALLRVGLGPGQIVQEILDGDVLGVTLGLQAHEVGHGLAAHPGVNIVDLADVGHVGHLVRLRRLGQGAGGVSFVSAQGGVGDELARPGHVIQLVPGGVEAGGEGHGSNIHAVPALAAAGSGGGVGDANSSGIKP